MGSTDENVPAAENPETASAAAGNPVAAGPAAVSPTAAGPEPGHGQTAIGTSEPGAEEAYERYRAARERYAVAKYEYKAAQYALKAARLREQVAAGGSGGKRGKTEKRDKDGTRDHHHHRRRHRHGGHQEHRDYGQHGQYGHVEGDSQEGVAGRGALGPVETRDSSDRRKGRQVVLDVISTERLGEHFQRLTLGGPGFTDFRDNHYTDKYVKILFVDPALELTPPYDVQTLRKSLPKHQRPVRRTYTVHSVDAEAGTLVIDFVLHGDSGVAGPWAAAAKVGDQVAFAGPGGKYAPDAAADAHLLVGDESALPAISAALAEMPEDATGQAFIEVGGPADEWELTVPSGVEVTWLHRGGEYRLGRSQLAATVEGIGRAEWPAGRVHAFVHGEKSMVKRLRRHLTEERGVDRKMLSLSSYWTYGKADD
ncbi:siderophore-interacting protein [Citricoccus sp.]|uniref:siderophore-interacting protein n=1 Tax=Citricoccus sp. TaxID=1978372 RepID=UPI0028BE4BC3|nr:siderophore-interacting protein [Citricoccus sp.]